MRVRVVVGLVALAVAARLAAAAALGGAFRFADEPAYLDATDRLLDGRGFDAAWDRAPAYPLFLAPLRRVGAGLVGVRALQGAVTATGCALVVALAAPAFGARAAVAAGLLYALDPLLVVAGALLYPEAVAALVLLGVLLLAVRGARDDALLPSAGAGVALGVLAQLRPATAVLVPVVAAWTAAARRRAVHAAAIVLASLLVLAPWTWRTWRVHGALAPIATRGVETAPVAGETVRTRGVIASFVEQVRDQPAALAGHVARELLHFWELRPARLATDDLATRAALHAGDPRLPLAPPVPPRMRDAVSMASSGTELALALLGLATVRRDGRRTAALLVAVTLACAFAYALFIAKLRFRITVVPLVLVLAGSGAATVLGHVFSGCETARGGR